MGQSSALGISYSFFSSFTDAGVLVPATAVARESAATVSLFLAMVADDDALVTALILCCCCAGYEYSSLFCLLRLSLLRLKVLRLVEYRWCIRCRSAYCLLVRWYM